MPPVPGGESRSSAPKAKFLRLLLPVLLAALLSSTGSAAAVLEVKNVKTSSYVAVPGSGVYFLLPSGVVLSAGFDGFESRERRIEVIVASIAAPLSELEAGFTEASFRSCGIELKSRGDLVVNGAKAILFKALHPDGGTNWGKWIMLAENGADTLIVNAVFVSGDTEAASDLEAMLKGVFIEPPAAPAVTAGSPAPQSSPDIVISSESALMSAGLRPIISSSGDEMPRVTPPEEPASTNVLPAAPSDGFDKEAALRKLAGEVGVARDVAPRGEQPSAEGVVSSDDEYIEKDDNQEEQ